MSLQFDYPALVQRALRRTLADILRQADREGLRDPHSLYFRFRTDHPDAALPAGLRQEFPEEMTIVLQHQFWELEVEEDRFAVTLRFGGQPRRVEVPFEAVVAFHDPGAEFGLQFQAEVPEIEEDEPGDDTTGVGAEVVSIDRFRSRTVDD